MFDREIHHRRSIRLPGFDYAAAGFYFVTICVQGREALLGEIRDGEIELHDAGRMVEQTWREIPHRFPNVALDEYTVMPNHFHGLLQLTDPNTNDHVGAPLAAPQYHPTEQANQGAASSAPTLGNVVRAFKSISAIAVNRIIGRSGQPFWQRNYYERIIRNEDELHSARQYIRDNPLHWAADPENPAATP